MLKRTRQKFLEKYSFCSDESLIIAQRGMKDKVRDTYNQIDRWKRFVKFKSDNKICGFFAWAVVISIAFQSMIGLPQEFMMASLGVALAGGVVQAEISTRIFSKIILFPHRVKLRIKYHNLKNEYYFLQDYLESKNISENPTFLIRGKKPSKKVRDKIFINQFEALKQKEQTQWKNEWENTDEVSKTKNQPHAETDFAR